MANVKVSDLADEAQVTSDENGVTALRKFLVTELSGSASGRLFEAINTPGIPIRGQTHPGLNGIVVKSVNAVPVPGCVSAAWVLVSYASPTFNTQTPSETATPTYRMSGTVQEEETTEDKDGNQMVLNHTKTSVAENGQNIDTVLPPQPAKVSVQRPMQYFQCDRPEPLPFNYDKVHNFVGRVNSVPWRNFAARTVLCSTIDVEESGDRANVSYQFQIKPVGTWVARLVYIDPETGAPVEAPLENVGIKNFLVYPEAEFNQLSV
jgi:hypothetical protein